MDLTTPSSILASQGIHSVLIQVFQRFGYVLSLPVEAYAIHGILSRFVTKHTQGYGLGVIDLQATSIVGMTPPHEANRCDGMYRHRGTSN